MVLKSQSEDIADQLAGIVGPDFVSSGPAALEEYSRDNSFVLPIKPWFAVKPRNSEEVQSLVKWANRTLTPLVPVSSGPPRFLGDTVPSVTGAVMVDLSRLDRIIRIDRKNRMAVIEPGVNFARLQTALAGEGLRLSMPLFPRANKSVITSLLERQPTLVPKYQWSLPEPLRCLEIVWGSGEVLWTGEAGSQPHSLEKQWEKGWAQINPMGPQETDWHRLVSAAQGSMGIVTWASVKCEILPSVHKILFIPAKELSDLTDCAYRLLRVRLGDEFLILNRANLAGILGRDAGEIAKLQEVLPAWVIILGVAGRGILPAERVRVQEEDISEIAQHYGLSVLPGLPGAGGRDILNTLLQPSPEPYWKLASRGGCQSIFFLTTLDKTPEFASTLFSLAEAAQYPSADIGVYIQPQHQGVSYHCEFNLPFDPASSADRARVSALSTRASREFISRGAFFSRPYGEWAKMVYDRDAQSTILLKKIKGIFDPNNILNPGKLCF